MIIAQEPAQSLAALHRPLALPIRRQRKQQDVALPLVIPLGVEMVDIVAQRPPQRPLAVFLRLVAMRASPPRGSLAMCPFFVFDPQAMAVRTFFSGR